MAYLRIATMIIVLLLGLAGISAGLLLMDRASNVWPLAGVFVVLGSVGLPIWAVRQIYWRKPNV